MAIVQMVLTSIAQFDFVEEEEPVAIIQHKPQPQHKHKRYEIKSTHATRSRETAQSRSKKSNSAY